MLRPISLCPTEVMRRVAGYGRRRRPHSGHRPEGSIVVRARKGAIADRRPAASSIIVMPGMGALARATTNGGAGMHLLTGIRRPGRNTRSWRRRSTLSRWPKGTWLTHLHDLPDIVWSRSLITSTSACMLHVSLGEGNGWRKVLLRAVGVVLIIPSPFHGACPRSASIRR